MRRENTLKSVSHFDHSIHRNSIGCKQQKSKSGCLEQKGISWPLELENPGVEPQARLHPGALVVLSGFVPLSFGLAVHQISFILCGSPQGQGLLSPLYTEDKLGPKKPQAFRLPGRDPGFEPTSTGLCSPPRWWEQGPRGNKGP